MNDRHTAARSTQFEIQAQFLDLNFTASDLVISPTESGGVAYGGGEKNGVALFKGW